MDMNPPVDNLFADIPDPAGGEQVRTLALRRYMRVERIVSNGQGSPPGFWYDQENDEWVVLLQGTAKLAFADGRSCELKSGDYLMIRRHLKHRVEETSADAVWLAVHTGRLPAGRFARE
jgi:cupin 2 domain-containing protein